MNENFATSSLYLAAFIAASGITLERTNALPGGKFEFIFQNSRANFAADDFLLGSGSNINARRFVEEIRHLKALIYDR